MSRTNLPRSDVLGVDVAVGVIDSAAESVIGQALSQQGGYAVLCNVHVLMTARSRSDVREALRGAWAVFPDGAPIAWLQRRHGHVGAQRVAGPDLMPAVLDRGRLDGLRHVLFGSTPGVVGELRRELTTRFSGVEIVAALAPSPGEEDEGKLLAQLRSYAPHIVWVALGAPKQELWMRRHSADLAPALVVGVGAAFDFHAGAKSRAPSWMQRFGLEWLHRLASEPRRLGRRYATTNTLFALLAARQVIRRRGVT